MTETLYLLTICLPLATVLVIFGMRYAAANQQARATLAADTAYRRIAEQAATGAIETTTLLADIRTRLAAIEKVLKEVE